MHFRDPTATVALKIPSSVRVTMRDDIRIVGSGFSAQLATCRGIYVSSIHSIETFC